MTDIKHTPRPWQLTSDPYEDGTPYFKIRGGEGHYQDEDGNAVGFQIDAIMSEADARLIAAAPDLLAVAVEARKITLETAEATGMHRPALICQLDAAIAKTSLSGEK